MTNQTPNELRSLRLFLLFAIGLGAILPLCDRGRDLAKRAG
jgi:hypothetical protein